MGMVSIFLSLLLISFGFAVEAEVYYCVQVASSKTPEPLKAQAEGISDFPDVRVEKIGDFYTLRVGYFKSESELKEIIRRVKQIFPDSFPRRCAYIPARVVFQIRTPPPVKAEPKVSTPKKEAKQEPRTVQESGISESGKGINPAILVILFPLLFLLPFLPALVEYILKRDAKPIDINLSFSRDPAYFGRSFLNLLERGLRSIGFENLSKVPQGTFKIPLSKGEEWVMISDVASIELQRVVNIPVVLIGNLTIEQPILFKREVVVFGDLNINAPCTFRALYVTGSCYINQRSSVIRWLHVGKDLYVRASANLGHNAYVKQRAEIRGDTEFRRLYAKEIISADKPLIDEASSKNVPIIVKGNIRTSGDMIIGGEERPVIFNGDIFSDKNIELFGDVWVKGSVFSQQNVKMENGVVVGEKDKVKSVVAKKKLEVKGNFKVYGYMHTEGEGRVFL